MMKIGCIGTGNMGSALMNGLSRNAEYTLFAFDTIPQKAAHIKNATVCESVADIAQKSDILILTIKPNVYDTVLHRLAEISYNKILISVAPGITVSYMQNILPKAKIMRTMPNTPAMVGEGMILISETDDKNLRECALSIFSNVGRVEFLPESLFEAGTALSGSSPALIYYMIDIMANNALSYGISKQKALKIAAQTVLGSAKMVLESDAHPGTLIDNVCSPGGTTIAAMNILKGSNFENAVHNAMNACVDKAKSMKK